MNENNLLQRITINPQIFGGKPIIRGRRLAVEHVLGMLAAGDTIETLMEGYPWLEKEDVLACQKVLELHGLELLNGAIVTVETGRLRI